MGNMAVPTKEERWRHRKRAESTATPLDVVVSILPRYMTGTLLGLAFQTADL
jgi:hypothetical protein